LKKKLRNAIVVILLSGEQSQMHILGKKNNNTIQLSRKATLSFLSIFFFSYFIFFLAIGEIFIFSSFSQKKF
jgi:hypothetical protein